MSSQDNSNGNNNRRDFLRKGGVGLLAAVIGSRIALKGDVAFAQAGAANLPLVKDDDPTAKALGYVADAKKVDTKKWPKRAGAEGGKQYCYNCQFYQVKADPKASKQGPCTLFPGKAVASQGWCNSWTQNPAVKS